MSLTGYRRSADEGQDGKMEKHYCKFECGTRQECVVEDDSSRIAAMQKANRRKSTSTCNLSLYTFVQPSLGEIDHEISHSFCDQTIERLG